MDYDMINMSDISLMDTIGSSIIGVFTGTTHFISLALTVFFIICFWKLFTKTRRPGWAAIAPIYNIYTLFKISFGSGWFFLLALIPIVNIVVLIIYPFKLAKAFGQETAFGLGLLLLSIVFIPILAFGSSTYVGQE